MKNYRTTVVAFMMFWLGMLADAQNQASYRWDNVTIGGGGFVSGVYFSPIEPNVGYVRTDVGGAYRWDAGSEKWLPLMDWVNADERGLLGIESLAIDPNLPGTLYMMAGTVYWNQANDGIGRSAFLRSDDYGANWESIPVWNDEVKYFNVHGNGMGRGNGERLAVDPANSNTLFYGSRNKGLWKSGNKGSTWSKVTSFPVDTTWNGAGISFVVFDPSTAAAGQTQRIYVGLLRKTDNLFVSNDGGNSWELLPQRPLSPYAPDLMPQRMVVHPDGGSLFITFGNGAGPHSMQWDEGWGNINDWFNRGAIYKYLVSTKQWRDVSPQNFIDPSGDGDPADPSTFYGCYSGLALDPNNPERMVASSIASYRGPQFWQVDGQWEASWGDNIYVTEDGGESWIPSFQYYWLDGGQTPPVAQMDENGVPWMVGNTIHWIGSVAIDPFRPERVFVTSGNGVFSTSNIYNYERTFVNEWGAADTSYVQRTVWQFAGQGIEEVVPEEVVSIPGGPLVSVIGDYDGFVHDNIRESPALGRHSTLADGGVHHLGSTRGLAYAPLSGKLAKCADARSVSIGYNDIPIGPVQYSTDGGATWTVETYSSQPPAALKGGKVALSADGEVTLWMPSEGQVMYRHQASSWTTVEGIHFNGRPVGDEADPLRFYMYHPGDGYMYVSSDKGVSFVRGGYVGTSAFKRAVSVPEKAGHVWVPRAETSGGRTGGLYRSEDGGLSFSRVPGVDYCEAVGFGKAAEGADHPTVFVFAEIEGVLGLWRSTNAGTSWVRINDDAHEYGGLANGEFVVGDRNVFGRVYMSTAGRGIAYGEPTGESVEDPDPDPDPDPVFYSLHVSVQGSGTVNVQDGEYAEDSRLTLVAEASEGYVFEGWSGSLSSTSSVLELVMNSDITLTGTFAPEGINDPDPDPDPMTPCNNPQSITLPFVQNGEGQFCWVTNQTPGYINSWNLDELLINGADYTNTWASSLPAPIDGMYYISYKGSFAWSHFEIPQIKTATMAQTTEEVSEPVFSSNPFTDELRLQLPDYEKVRQITVSTTSGKVIDVLYPEANVVLMGAQWPAGIYLVAINYPESRQVFKVVKE